MLCKYPACNGLSGANRPTFLLELMSGSILPGRGGVLPTFTRATVATITDQDLVVRQVLSGEARFGGFRRVQNLAGSNSENLTQGTWVGAGALPTTVNSATTMTFGAQFQNLGKQINTVSGNTYRFTFDVRWISGNTALHFVYNNGGTFTALTITPTTQRVSVLFTSTFTGADRIGLQDRNAAGFGQVYYTRYQVEDVTGQSNQNPAEYVSVGVLSAPYQGANVDGVQYFPCLNGNTVASNVVTEATGAMISSSILGGYLAEPAATNLCLQSETFDSVTWVKTDTTITTDNTAAPDGKTTADLATEGVAGTAIVTQGGMTIAVGNTVTQTMYLKRGNHDWCLLTVGNNVAATGFRAWFNLNTGAIGTTGALGTGTFIAGSITSAANGFYRLSITGIVDPATTTAVSVFIHSASADNSGTRVNNATHWLWGADFKIGNFNGLINSYIPTVAATVTRNADVLTYATTGWLNAAAGTLYAEWFNPNLSGTYAIASINDGGGTNVIVNYATTITTAHADVTAGGVAQSALSAVSVTGGAIAKCVSAYQLNDFAGFANNTSLGTDTVGTLPTVTIFNVGSNVGGIQQLGHYVRKVAYYPVRMVNGTAQDLTR